jgi:hypothetical protein
VHAETFGQNTIAQLSTGLLVLFYDVLSCRSAEVIRATSGLQGLCPLVLQELWNTITSQYWSCTSTIL